MIEVTQPPNPMINQQLVALTLWSMSDSKEPLFHLNATWNSNDLSRHLGMKERIATLRYCIAQDFVDCYLGTYHRYEDLLFVPKPACYTHIANPVYWQWPKEGYQTSLYCCVVETTLKGTARIGTFYPLTKILPNIAIEQ